MAVVNLLIITTLKAKLIWVSGKLINTNLSEKNGDSKLWGVSLNVSQEMKA